jgi:hypothetical protein
VSCQVLDPGTVKTGLLSFFSYHCPIPLEIARCKANKEEFFTGQFQPKSAKRTTIVMYSKNRVPEFADFWKQIRKIIPQSGW